MKEKIIELDIRVNLLDFYGVNNSNVHLLKNIFTRVHILSYRDHSIKVKGYDNDLSVFEKSIRTLEKYCLKNNFLDDKIILQLLNGNHLSLDTKHTLILHGLGGKAIIARTKNQNRLVEKFENNDLLFAIGPAGSGKTYTAIALAVKYLKNKSVRRIILSRPAVEAGEKLGFLPGDMKDKIDPYLQPLYDALQDMMPVDKLRAYIDNGVIQIVPLAFMRGRTLSDAVVILDEGQNTTSSQLKMFLTRMGMNSKMIITGDVTQIDLASNQRSGLVEALSILEGIKGIERVDFDKSDIVRHSLVNEIVSAYEKKHDETNKISIDKR